MKTKLNTGLRAFYGIAMLMVMAFPTQAQTNVNNPYPKTITVEGSAEMEVVPDEVYVQFTVKEYNKKGFGKQDIDSLKNQFLRARRIVGIADSDINIIQYGGENGTLPHKRKNPDLMASITYEVRLRSPKTLDRLTALLDDEAISSFEIIRSSHSNASQFRKELKIKALKAAKEKAGYLAAAIEEEAGVAITIEEIEYGSLGRLTNTVSQSNSRGGSFESDGSDGIAFRKIKYRYVMKAVFALK